MGRKMKRASRRALRRRVAAIKFMQGGRFAGRRELRAARKHAVELGWLPNMHTLIGEDGRGVYWLGRRRGGE